MRKMFDASLVAEDFPVLSTRVYGKPLVYLDNAATTQLPLSVLDVLSMHYRTQNGNVHRGNHYLSMQSTLAVENARKKIQEYLGARSEKQIVFTYGTTDSIDLVAKSYLEKELKAGEQVIVSQFEHHSNFVIWQELCKEKGAGFVVVPEKNGTIDMDFYRAALTKKTRLVSMTMVSNVTGIRLPIETVIQYAHEAGAPVCIDAAQAIRHGVNVEELECDFLCFSGHKMMGPGGTGILYVTERLLNSLHPVRFGGGMVNRVTEYETTYSDMPFLLEAGTPNIPGIIGLGAAVDYLQKLGTSNINKYEKELTAQLEEVLMENDRITILGSGLEKNSVISISLKGVNAFDAACLLDRYGIAVRAGNHCAQPILKKLGFSSVLRFSPAFYNTKQQIESLGPIMSEVFSFLLRKS